MIRNYGEMGQLSFLPPKYFNYGQLWGSFTVRHKIAGKGFSRRHSVPCRSFDHGSPVVLGLRRGTRYPSSQASLSLKSACTVLYSSVSRKRRFADETGARISHPCRSKSLRFQRNVQGPSGFDRRGGVETKSPIHRTASAQ
jgi:hypothetical protein